jgi:serine phosphatase RsbU (regulator of sigma subunit)
MSNLIQKILLNVKTRMMFIIYMCIIGISAFFVTYSYFSTLELYERKELEVLYGVVSSLAFNIDGDAHQELTSKYEWRDEIKSIEQDSIYHRIHHILAHAQLKNHFNSPLFTMVYDPDEKIFYTVVKSDSSFSYRHSYEFFPDILVDSMKVGGILPKYQNERGIWLSAFHPIHNSKGEIVALLQADLNFGNFQNEVFYHHFEESMWALAFIVLLALFLIPYVRRILKEDESLKEEIIYQKNLIDAKNKDLTDSVNYASKIQEAMLPDTARIQELLPDSFVFYKPRDIVSGDFYWFREKDNKMYVAAADCTGHGIPGALMSMIGHSSLNGITAGRKERTTGEVLNELDKTVTSSLDNKEYKTESKDGMDIGIVKIDLDANQLEFSGAFQNLVCINGNEIKEYKGNRFPIGGGNNYNKTDFDTQIITIQPGDQFYMYSDGFPDQFGGEKEKKYLDKNFKLFLQSLTGKSPEEKKTLLNEELLRWQGPIEQVDDILVIGLSF